MARARGIKPGFFRNADLAELQVEARLLFIGLWTLADREGRLEDRPKQIKMEVFPADSLDVEPMLEQLHKAGFITRYEVAGVKYAQVVNFTKHQTPHHKEVSSEIPAPPGCQQVTRHAYDVPTPVRNAVFDRDGHACLKCGAADLLSIDHVVPLAAGGDNSASNLQTLCKRCNSSKGNQTKDYRKSNVDPTLNQRKSNVKPTKVPLVPLTPDSGLLTPDSGLLTADSRLLTAEDDSSSSPPAPTDAGRICLVVKSEGIGLVNPNHPDLIELLENGATTIDFIEASRITVKAAKGFSYMLGVVKGRLLDQKNVVKKPDKLESFAERDARVKRARWEVMTNKIHPDNVGKLPYPLETVVDVASKILEVAQ